MANRDNFSQNIIEILKSRVANRCSNPSCRVPTSGPTTDPEKVNSIGVAAHICAAAPGGARYDKKMSQDERKNIENAIWLCSNCSIDIDRDAAIYELSILKSWKKVAEETARKELGNKIPSQQDTINTVAAALTGLPNTFLPEAIGNVCKASEKVLENLDPRFMVTASYQNNQSSFSIFAKEKVNCKINIDDDFRTEFHEKYKQLINHGDSLEIDSRAVKLTGSKLLEAISAETVKGKFSISSMFKKSAIQKIWLINQTNYEVFILNDIVGELTLGKESFNFKGTAFNGLFEIIYRKEFVTQNEGKLVFKINIDFQKWFGTPIDILPHFEKMYDFFSHLIDGWSMSTKLEAEGRDVFLARGGNFDSQDEIMNFYVLFRYIFLAREVLSHINRQVTFNDQFDYAEDIHEKLYEIYKIITGDNLYKYDQLGSNATCTLIADDNLTNIKLLTSCIEPTAIKFEQKVKDTILFCGEIIELPRLYHVLTKVKPKINSDISSLQPGQDVFIEWVPEIDCEQIIDIILIEPTEALEQTD